MPFANHVPTWMAVAAESQTGSKRSVIPACLLTRKNEMTVQTAPSQTNKTEEVEVPTSCFTFVI